MKKYSLFTLILLALLTACEPQSSFTRSTVIVSNEEYSGPTVADDGRSIVFRGHLEGKPVIYVAYDSNWGQPEVAVTLDTPIEGTTLTCQDFFKHQEKDQSINYNGPTIEGNYITFGALLSNGASGVLYAEKKDQVWKVHLVAQKGAPLPQNPERTYAAFNAPYLANNIVKFLAKDDQGEDYVFYHYPEKGSTEAIVSSLDNTPGIQNFWDMSVNKDFFSVGGILGAHQHNYYYVGHKTFKQASPDHYDGLGEGPIYTHGPTFFYAPQTEQKYFISNGASPHSLEKKVAGLYTNAGAHNPSQPYIITGMSWKDRHIDMAGNPTLSVIGEKGFIAFQASFKENPNHSSALFAIFENGESTVLPIVLSGDKIDGKVVKHARLGPVSLREFVMPVYIIFEDGQQGVYIYRYKHDTL